jgi:hypothetical protein
MFYRQTFSVFLLWQWLDSRQWSGWVEHKTFKFVQSARRNTKSARLLTPILAFRWSTAPLYLNCTLLAERKLTECRVLNFEIQYNIYAQNGMQFICRLNLRRNCLIHHAIIWSLGRTLKFEQHVLYGMSGFALFWGLWLVQWSCLCGDRFRFSSTARLPLLSPLVSDMVN